MNQKQKMTHLNGLIEELVEAREECSNGVDSLYVMMLEAEIFWFCASMINSKYAPVLLKEWNDAKENYYVAKAEQVRL